MDAEIDRLVREIAVLGDTAEGGEVSVRFGVLFERYQSISDSLVGILKRAKKRKLSIFET